MIIIFKIIIFLTYPTGPVLGAVECGHFLIRDRAHIAGCLTVTAAIVIVGALRDAPVGRATGVFRVVCISPFVTGQQFKRSLKTVHWILQNEKARVKGGRVAKSGVGLCASCQLCFVCILAARAWSIARDTSLEITRSNPVVSNETSVSPDCAGVIASPMKAVGPV